MTHTQISATEYVIMIGGEIVQSRGVSVLKQQGLHTNNLTFSHAVDLREMTKLNVLVFLNILQEMPPLIICALSEFTRTHQQDNHTLEFLRFSMG